MPQVQLRCPLCKTMGNVTIKEDLIKNTSRGLVAVVVSMDTVCTHSFIAYIDKNLSVRDYFTTDFEVEIPKMLSEQKAETISKINPEFLDLDLIRLNIPAALLTFMVKSFIFKKKIAYISVQSFLNDHVMNFFSLLTDNSFDVDLQIISEEEYKNNKKMFEDHVVLGGNKIIKNPHKIINEKKLRVEKKLISQFFNEYNANQGFNSLKNEIYKAFTLAIEIKEYANSYKKIKGSESAEDSLVSSIISNVVNPEKFIAKVVSDYFSAKYDFKIQKTYLNYLLEMTKHYFDVDLHKKFI